MFDSAFKRLLQRPADSYKFNFGHVLVNSGSAGMMGAATLTAQAALRSGAGLVTLALNHSRSAAPPQLWLEIMTATISDEAELDAFVQDRKVSVVAIGSGLTPSTTVLARVQWLLDQPELIVVLDGGALTSLQYNIDILDKRRCQAVILTPHPGEFKRLLATELASDRLKQVHQARAFAEQHDVVCVLKGSETVVAARGASGYTNTTGNPGLATAGSGDVLTGIIAGLAAQGLSPFLAAQCGVYLHGLCGDIASAQLTQPAVNATDIIAAIAPAYKQLEAEF